MNVGLYAFFNPKSNEFIKKKIITGPFALSLQMHFTNSTLKVPSFYHFLVQTFDY